MKLIILLLFAALPACAQLSENFDDGDLTDSPVWIQQPGDFVIYNGELRSASQTPNHTFQIYTASNMTVGEWHFKVRLNYATSGTNYADIFLLADATDFATSKGYFVRVGGTDDEITLFRKDANGEVKIIDGENGFVRTNVDYSIKVVRTNNHHWALFADNRLIGLVQDSNYNTSDAFGFRIRQSTASFFEKHFFDDILLQQHTPDVTPPVLTNVLALTASQLQVEFDEAVSLNGYLPSLFYVEHIGFPSQVNVSNNIVVLNFSQPFPEGENLRLTVHEVYDVWNNLASDLTSSFTYYVPQFGSVIIHEIFADPDPPMLMPQVEWIELRNTTQHTISLNGWKFCKPTGCSTDFPNIVLQPDSLLIITSTQDTSMHRYGRTLKVPGFPGLGNAGDEIWLESSSGAVIHAVAYSDEWYDNPLKIIGGWSLEMIDPSKPCSGKINWRASEEHQGATPGRYNSINDIINDEERPILNRVYMTDSMTVELVFSKSMQINAVQPAHFQIENSALQIATVDVMTPMHQKIILKLSQPVASNEIYHLNINGLRDCTGNVFPTQTIQFALAHTPVEGEVIINEILFNPTPAGTDYVELYNRTDRVLDLKYLYLANTNTSGVTSNIAVIEPRGFAFFPGSFVVISKDSGIVQREYVYQNPESFINMPTLPAYNDNTGKVILMNQSGVVLDEVEYNADWHYPLLDNVEGVSLERIRYQDGSNNKMLWHSASRSVGYGTPGYKNSQFQSGVSSGSHVNFSTNIVSPNNDGRDDFLNIEFTFFESGNLSNIYIFDPHGRVVRILHRNILNGTTGRWVWDGLGNQNKPLPTGRYVVLIEVFNINGKYDKFKKVITVIHP